MSTKFLRMINFQLNEFSPILPLNPQINSNQHLNWHPREAFPLLLIVLLRCSKVRFHFLFVCSSHKIIMHCITTSTSPTKNNSVPTTTASSRGSVVWRKKSRILRMMKHVAQPPPRITTNNKSNSTLSPDPSQHRAFYYAGSKCWKAPTANELPHPPTSWIDLIELLGSRVSTQNTPSRIRWSQLSATDPRQTLLILFD